MKNALQNIWLWIIVLFEYTCDVCRYGLQGAEDKTLDKAIGLRDEIQLRLDKFDSQKSSL